MSKDPELDAVYAKMRAIGKALEEYAAEVVRLTGMVTCPACDQPPGKRCANLSNRRRKKPLPDAPIKVPHGRRLDAYTQQVGPLPEKPRCIWTDVEMEKLRVDQDRRTGEKFARRQEERARLESLRGQG